MAPPSFPSTPRYQPAGKQVGLPMSELKVVLMSFTPGLTSNPASLLASACWYQVLGKGAFAKFRCEDPAEALPRTPLVASQVCGFIWAPTRICTELLRMLPQMFAAYWNTYRRCSPSVVPGFPPTGATGVGSLKPSLGPSLLTIVMVAAARALPDRRP